MSKASQYVAGTPAPNQKGHATFETKGGDGSGAGYERWRSTEWRPHTARQAKEDVYVPVHRLLAVVACYPEDMAIEDILEHMADKDVHHRAPEAEGDRGIKWDNRPDSLVVIDHGRHSEITRAEMKAWAEDAKRATQQSSIEENAETCAVCDESGTLATIPGESGAFCLDCARDVADGRPIEL